MLEYTNPVVLICPNNVRLAKLVLFPELNKSVENASCLICLPGLGGGIVRIRYTVSNSSDRSLEFWLAQLLHLKTFMDYISFFVTHKIISIIHNTVENCFCYIARLN